MANSVRTPVLGEFDGGDTAGDACAGDDHLGHPLGAGALDHRGAVVVKPSWVRLAPTSIQCMAS